MARGDSDGQRCHALGHAVGGAYGTRCVQLHRICASGNAHRRQVETLSAGMLRRCLRVGLAGSCQEGPWSGVLHVHGPPLRNISIGYGIGCLWQVPSTGTQGCIGLLWSSVAVSSAQ